MAMRAGFSNEKDMLPPKKDVVTLNQRPHTEKKRKKNEKRKKKKKRKKRYNIYSAGAQGAGRKKLPEQ